MKLLRNFEAASVLGTAGLAALLVTGLASPAKAQGLVEKADVVMVECIVEETHPTFQFLSASEGTFDVQPVFMVGKTRCVEVVKFLVEQGFVNVREVREIGEIREIAEAFHLPSPGIVEKKVPFLWTFIREANGNGVGELVE